CSSGSGRWTGPGTAARSRPRSRPPDRPPGRLPRRTLPDVAFRGWPTEALEFYEGLEADNSRTYWLDHKETYDKQVYGPMADLLAELEPEFGPGRIFRPNRDVRFSADKSPYKTAIAAT